jgi:hypothetical protein
MNKKVETDFIVQKYAFILFSDRIQQSDCFIFADIVLNIYDRLELESLPKEHLNVVLNFIFSCNGVMSNSPQLKQQAAYLFLQWYKNNKNQSEMMRPFVSHFLQNLAP